MKLSIIPVIFFKHSIASLIYLFFLINTTYGQYNVDLVSTLGYSNGKFSFINETEGFHFSGNQILKTIDSGHTWNVLLSDITALTHDEGLYMNGCFVTSDIGWVVLRKYDDIDNIKDSSFLYKTIDAGASWELQHINPPNDIVYAAATFGSVYFKNENQGWVYGNGLLEYTTDGGATWTNIIHHIGNSSNNDVINSLTFSDDNTAYTAGYGSWIQKSVDDGTTWNTQHYYPGQGVTDDYYIYDITFSPSNYDLGIAAISDGVLKKTSNGGVVWDDILTGYPHSNNAVAISPGDGSIWSAAGDYCNSNGCFWTSALLYSNDDGLSWNHIVDSPNNNSYSDIVWPSAEYGMTCNKLGEIYRISFENTSLNEISTTETVSIYPNPAVSEVTVVHDETLENIKITLYDIQGKEVLSESSDSYKTILDVSILTEGVYTVVITSEELIKGRSKLIIQ
ncbi:MAG: T9SS type A sorting domain-containing protein [Crocinitomicaceae bacterium]|nr:T9SS type A sorting domain-containing protein [Crocinitomicaceae bacterium]